MKIYIPTNLIKEINFIIKANHDFVGITPNNRKKLTTTLISIWYYIYTEQRRNKELTTLFGYTNINRNQLNQFRLRINKKDYRYNNLLDLMDGRIIDINQKYKVGEFTKGYRVKTSFIGNNLTEIEIDFDKIFKNIKSKEYWVKLYPNHEKLINDVYNLEVELSPYVEWLYDNEGKELDPILEKGILKKRTLNKERIYDYINDALMLNFQNIWFKVSDEGRFYNTSTNLSSTTLPFLKLRRDNIKEIDVSNCQPLLLCSIIDNDKYQNDVEEGIFYDVMAREMGIKRNEFKMLSYQHIFFSNKPLKSGKIYDTLEKVYPGLIKQINGIKENKSLARELQRLEADIFVNNIGKLDIPMILRHDGVFVHDVDYEVIEYHIKLRFKELGLSVSLNK